MSNKHFQIEKFDSIKELQEKFSCIYPFLKINIFINEGSRKKIKYQSIMYSPEVKMYEINKNFSEGSLELVDVTTVNELESKLFEQFGLSAQICRKTANIWLETTLTDHWTLKQQNDHGREISPNLHNYAYLKEVPNFF